MPEHDVTLTANFELLEDDPLTWITCPGIPTITDFEGNVYTTVLFGEQCWTREDVRTTKYTDGSSIITCLNPDE